jgi:hypothetical protein
VANRKRLVCVAALARPKLSSVFNCIEKRVGVPHAYYCDAIANALVMPNRLQCIWLGGFILK